MGCSIGDESGPFVGHSRRGSMPPSAQANAPSINLNRGGALDLTLLLRISNLYISPESRFVGLVPHCSLIKCLEMARHYAQR